MDNFSRLVLWFALLLAACGTTPADDVSSRADGPSAPDYAKPASDAAHDKAHRDAPLDAARRDAFQRLDAISTKDRDLISTSDQAIKLDAPEKTPCGPADQCDLVLEVCVYLSDLSHSCQPVPSACIGKEHTCDCLGQAICKNETVGKKCYDIWQLNAIQCGL